MLMFDVPYVELSVGWGQWKIITGLTEDEEGFLSMQHILIYGYLLLDIWLWMIQILRDETHCHYSKSYSFLMVEGEISQKLTTSIEAPPTQSPAMDIL